MEIQPFKNTPEDDYIEPEIVSGPGSGTRDNGRNGRRERRANAYSGPREDRGAPRPEPVNIPFYGVFLRIKFVFITAILLLSFGLIALGFILTSTIIGAIIGIPLLLLGGILLVILFKLLTLGARPT